MAGRSMVVGHILMDHTCSLMCTNHRDMIGHTQEFLTELGTTGIYAEHRVSQLAALRFKPVTCAFRVPCAIHLATTSILRGSYSGFYGV